MSRHRYFVSCMLSLLILAGPDLSLAQVEDRIYGSKHKEANRLFELAQEKVQNQNYQEALSLINQALQYQSDHVEGYFDRALVKEKIGDPQGALTDYQIVLLLDSTYKEAAFNRAKLRYQQKQYQRAKTDFQKVLTMSSSGTRMMYFKGTSLNQSPEAPVQSITTSYSMDADIYHYLGLCDQANNDFESSIIFFDRALSINPTDPNYLVNRGLSQSALDHTDLAIADFRAALSLSPEHPIAQFNLTQELESSGKLELTDYDEIIAQHPQFASAYINRALAKIQNGDLVGAILDYDQAIIINPSDPLIYVNRALAKERLKDFRGALVDYNMAVKLDQAAANAYRGRGRVLFELDETQLSIEDLNQAIKLDPKHGGSYFNRALVHRKLGNQQQTCSDLRKAKTLGVEMAEKALRTYCDKLN